MQHPPRLIGISGTFASGKDTVAEFLASDFGYTHISTGDMVRKIAQARHGSIERPVLLETAAELRRIEGAGALVIEALKEPRPLVITGIRALGEAKALQQAGGTLLFINAPIEIRYTRMKSRSRDNETALTLQEFTRHEAREWYAGPLDSDFNLRDIEKMSDITIDNSLTLELFLALVFEKLGLTK